MTDDLEIRRGGVLAVDTAELRAVADGWRGAGAALAALREDAEEMARAAVQIESVARTSFVGMPDPLTVGWRIRSLVAGIAAAADEAGLIAATLDRLALLYEFVELRAEVALGGDAARERLDALTSAHPAEARVAGDLSTGWWLRTALPVVTGIGDGALVPRTPDMLLPWAVSDPAAALGAFTTALGLISGAGSRALPARIDGGRGEVARPVGAPVPVASPTALADLVGRVPTGEGSERVRVDRFAMPDGTTRYAVYVTGTRALSGADPWNMGSNLQLYGGGAGASLAATADALRQAGARPGDVVYSVGHSQGGMIATALARSDDFRVPVVVTAGNPSGAEPGRATTAVALRHRDDPVAALATTGAAAPGGSSTGFVAERSAGRGGDPLAAHHLGEYVETARRVDASGDPRVVVVRDLVAELGTATRVERIDYAAGPAAPEPRPTPSPGPSPSAGAAGSRRSS